MTETVSTDGGALSFDQAVDSLIPQSEEQAPVEQTAPEASEIEAEASPAEEPEPAAETPEVEPAEEVEAVAPVEPPAYWSKEAKADFAALPANLQAVVLAQEGPREAAAAKAKQEAAEVRTRADQELTAVQRLADELGSFLPKAVETFKSRWDNVDWAATAEQYGADEAFKLRMQFEDEQKLLTQAQQAQQAAELTAHKAFLQAEADKLKGTPLESVETRVEVGKYLVDGGIDPKQLSHVTASELTIAHKAMLWDRAQANIKAKPVQAAPARPVVRPAAAAPPVNAASTAKNRFAQTRSVDDAVALLLSGKK